jgi:hypothetical protein
MERELPVNKTNFYTVKLDYSHFVHSSFTVHSHIVNEAHNLTE